MPHVWWSWFWKLENERGIRDAAPGIQNPNNDWNPESKKIQYLESGISSVESRIRDSLGFIPLYMGQLKTQSKLSGLWAPKNAERDAYH